MKFAPPTIAGYRIVATLAAGGTATVYRAVDEATGRDVALKVLLPHAAFESEAVGRFLHEIDAYRHLAHPNIIACLGGGSSETSYFVALEYVGGGDLRSLLKMAGRLPPRFAAQAVAQVLRALAHAHERGVVHRDVKPANIMIADGGSLKLADFGLSYATDFTRLTQAGSILGTPAYMAPEQVQGKALDALSDLFACGVVLYEMVTGKNPFATDHAATTLAAVTGKYPPPLGAVVPGVPPRLEDVAEKLLAKARSDRYENAAEALAELAPLLDGEADDGTFASFLRDPLPSLEAERRAEAKALLECGRRALRAGAREAAMLDFEEALECDSSFAEARTAVAACGLGACEAGATWRSERALDLAQEAMSDPRNVRALSNLVRYTRSQGDTKAMLRAYRWARRRARSDSFTMGQLVTLVGPANAAHLEGMSESELNRRLLTAGRPVAAAAPARSTDLLALAPILLVMAAALVLWFAPRPGARLEVPRYEVVETGPGDLAASRLASAQEALAGGDPAKALRLYRWFLANVPGDARSEQTLLDEGRALEALGRPAEALAVYENLLTSAPRGPLASEAHRRRAALFQVTGDWLGVLAELEAAAARAGVEERAQVLLEMGLVYERRGDTGRAQATYEELARAATANAPATEARLRLARLAVAAGDSGRARDILERLLKDVPAGSAEAARIRAELEKLGA